MIRVEKKIYSYFLDKNDKKQITYEINKLGFNVKSYCEHNGFQMSTFTKLINGETPLTKKMYDKLFAPLNPKIKLPKEFING